MTNKYLEKVAISVQSIKTFYKNNKGGLIGGAIGAGALGGAAATQKHTYVMEKGHYKKKPLTGWRRAHHITSSALIGGFAGSMIGSAGHPSQYRQYYQRTRSGYAGNTRPSRTIKDIHKDLNFPSGGFKTKSEAKQHFRRMASKYHPDKHGNTPSANTKMQTINRAWDEYEKHPEGFTKLANVYLEKIAKIDPKKIIDFVKRNPMATTGGAFGAADGFLSTTKNQKESAGKYHLRQVRKTLIGGATGAGVGALADHFIKQHII